MHHLLRVLNRGTLDLPKVFVMNGLIIGGIFALIGIWLMWGRKDIFALLGIVLFIVGLAIIIRVQKKGKNTNSK